VLKRYAASIIIIETKLAHQQANQGQSLSSKPGERPSTKYDI